MTLLSLKNDYVFKKTLTESLDILIDLINAVLEFPENAQITFVKIKNPDILPGYIGKKGIVLDIHAVDESGKAYDIEMQVRKFEAYSERALYYLCKLYSGQLKSGEGYGELNPVIGIHFLGYELFPEEDDFHFHFTLRDIRHPELELTDNFNLYIFELTGVEKTLEKTGDSRLEWLHYLNYAHKEEDDMITEKYSNPMIHKAHGILKTLSADEKVRQEAEMREQALIDERIFMAGERRKGIRIGREKGRVEGIEIGEKKRAIYTAREMLADGFDIDKIIKFTRLEADEIKALERGKSI